MEEEIAGVQDVPLAEVDHDVAVGVAAAGMDDADRLVAELQLASRRRPGRSGSRLHAGSTSQKLLSSVEQMLARAALRDDVGAAARSSGSRACDRRGSAC